MNSELLDVLDAWLDSRLDQVHTMLPAVVESYDPSNRTAKVRPAVDMKLSGGEEVAMPAIAGVPVVFPSSGDFEILWPLKAGDAVMLMVAETGIGNFLNGNAQAVAEDSSRFTLMDCVAVPGMFRFGSMPKPPRRLVVDPDSDTVSMVNAGGVAVELSGSLLRLANDVSGMKAELDKLWDAVIAVRSSLATNFTAFATAATTDGVIPTTNTAFSTAALGQTNAIPALTASKAQVAQLLKD